jgi:hypothetical protein
MAAENNLKPHLRTTCKRLAARTWKLKLLHKSEAQDVYVLEELESLESGKPFNIFQIPVL